MSPVEENRRRTRRTLHEAAHKLGVNAGEGVAASVVNGKPAQKRVLNEAAHKLGYWRRRHRTAGRRVRGRPASDSRRLPTTTAT